MVEKKKIKEYKSEESFRKFRAYTHMRQPNGKMAKHKSDTISARTPASYKAKIVKIAGHRHTVDIV